MLFSERKRKEAIAAQEAAGQSLWSANFDRAALVRIAEFWRLIKDGIDEYDRSMARDIGALMRIRTGRPSTSVDYDDLPTIEDTELILDVLGAVYEVIKNKRYHGNEAEQFAKVVNHVLREHRIAYKFVEGELIEFSSDELHTEVVEPALRLLVTSQFAKAHGAYMDALKEISRGNAGDAITDAGTALQETLNALGCEGNRLGALIKDARRRGLLAAHDTTLLDGVIKFFDWASADRSESGDGHKHTDAALADAWLMVHIVGALIVRLADPAKRGEPSG